MQHINLIHYLWWDVYSVLQHCFVLNVVAWTRKWHVFRCLNGAAWILNAFLYGFIQCTIIFLLLGKWREFQITWRCLCFSATPNQNVVLVYWTYHANRIPNDKMIQNVQPTVLLDRHIKMHSNDIFIFLVSNDFSFRSLCARCTCMCVPSTIKELCASTFSIAGCSAPK